MIKSHKKLIFLGLVAIIGFFGWQSITRAADDFFISMILLRCFRFGQFDSVKTVAPAAQNATIKQQNGYFTDSIDPGTMPVPWPHNAFL